MADLPPYVRSFSFADFQANQPRAPQPGVHIDRELDDIAARLLTFGKTAFEIAQETGFVGGVGDWLLSLVGPRGLQGPQGLQGLTGAQGLQGLQGLTGLQGLPGVKGDTGLTGATGATGAVGAQGVKGDTGQQGIQGVQGLKGDTGLTGAQGAGVTIKGSTASPSTLPTSGASVGDTYIMTGSGTGYASGDGYVFTNSGQDSGPGNNWKNVGQIRGPAGVAGAKGDTGSTGAQGSQGTQGLQGVQGPQGNPTTVNGKSGASITLTASDVGALATTGGAVNGTVTLGGQTAQYPTNLALQPTSNPATGSTRAGLGIGNFFLLQDIFGNGGKDFSLYNSNTSSSPIVVAADNTIQLLNRPVFNGQTPFDAGNVPVASKAINFRKKQFLVTDYGAIDTGAGDATSTAANRAAILAALADIKAQAFSGSLVFPNGRFVLNQTLEDYALPHGIDVEGTGNSELFFYGLPQSANGLGLGTTGGADGRLKVRGLRVIGRNFGSNQCGTLLALYGSGEQGGVAIDTLLINADGSCLATNYLLIKNPAASGNIRGINILGGGGQYGATGATTGINVFSDRLATDVCFHDVTMQAVGTGFKATMAQTQGQYTLEGVAFKDCVLVGVQTGLNAVSGWYAAPGYSWEGGHVNAQLYCFRLDNVSYFAVRNVNAQLDFNNNPQSIIYGTSCPGIHVSGNRFGIVDQIGSGAGKPNIAGVVAGNGCSMWSVTDNIFSNFTPGSSCVVAQAGASGIYARGNKKFASGSTSGAMLAGAIDDGNNVIFS